MEAQYALQKKKPLVPLKLTKGYEADGWLGLLLGTSMWYAFYGETLSSASAFDKLLDGLCREIGSRGRADAVVAAVPSEPEPEPSHKPGITTDDPSRKPATGVRLTREQLGQLKLGQLVWRAVAEGIAAAALDDAEDSDDPQAAIIALLLAEPNGTAALRAELEGMKAMPLTRRAMAAGVSEAALEAADDADDARQAIIELVLRAEVQ
jgi:hypothetical protein